MVKRRLVASLAAVAVFGLSGGWMGPATAASRIEGQNGHAPELKIGDRVSLFGFDSRPRISSGAVTNVRGFPQLQRLAGQLDYSTHETNYTLGLATLTGGLNRRSLVVVFTEFTDQTAAELMIRAAASLLGRHLVLFVTLQDPELRTIVDAAPDSITGSMESVARSVVADELRRERLVVFEKLRRLGVQCLEAPTNRIGTDLINRYLAIKQREMI